MQNNLYPYILYTKKLKFIAERLYKINKNIFNELY